MKANDGRSALSILHGELMSLEAETFEINDHFDADERTAATSTSSCTSSCTSTSGTSSTGTSTSCASSTTSTSG